jgi:hypothetical protein
MTATPTSCSRTPINSNGSVQIWEMTGTSIIEATLNQGSQWHAIGTGDFNGDGMSDILFQNNNGTPVVWIMNGTSVVSTSTYPNPGSSWVLKDDGPIQSNGNGNGNSQGPSTHLSSPDGASAGVAQSAPNTPPSNNPAGAWMWSDADGGLSILTGPVPGAVFVATR